MKLNEILESEKHEWEEKRNPTSSLPELKCRMTQNQWYKIELAENKYRLFVAGLQFGRNLIDDRYDDIEKLRDELERRNLPLLTDGNLSWLRDDTHARVVIKDLGGSADGNFVISIPTTTLLKLTLNALKFEHFDSKEDVILDVKIGVKGYAFNTFDYIYDKFPADHRIQFAPITEKMIEDFVATRKYKAGAY